MTARDNVVRLPKREDPPRKKRKPRAPKQPAPERPVSYRDFLGRQSLSWRFEPTPKADGDLIMTSQGFKRFER